MVTNGMLLTIIVPTYNVEEFIANCLDSLLDQDISTNDYEILVINDGATDNSAQIAGTYADTHEHIRLINQANMGLSEARNTGLRQAKGKYTYFLDSDDYIAKNTFGLILSLLEKYQLDLLGVKEIETRRLDIKKSANLASIKTDHLKITDGISFIADNYYINNAWWYFTRTKFLRETGLTFPQGRLVEDANFTSKLLVAAQRMAFVPLDFYRYYQRPNSIMHKTNKAHIRRLIGDYEKNVYEFESQLKSLEAYDHPKIKACLKRIEVRQHSFAFFLFVKCMRFSISKDEVSTMIEGFKTIEVYPIQKFIGEDYNKFSYCLLLPIINNEKLFSTALKVSAIFQ